MFKKFVETLRAENWYLPYRLTMWWNDQDIFHPSRIYWKIHNVIRWLPVIWNDHDWDHSYLIRIMVKKLRHMEAHHRENKVIVDWETVADEIAQAAAALERHQKGEYVDEEMAAHRAKWPNSVVFGRTNRDPQETKEFLEICDLEEKRIEADLKLFADLFANKVRTWWD